MSGETPKILPKITLEEIYGLDFVLNPRASLTNYGWLPDSAARLDLLTGAPLLICGQMPVICSHSVTTEKVRSLFSVAGLEMAPPRHTYRSPSGYRQILDSLHQQKRKLVVYHRHPPEEINYDD